MALSSLPYKAKITARSAIAAANAQALTIVVTDNANATRTTTTINVSNTISLEELESKMRERIEVALLADAGGATPKLTFIDAMISGGTLLTL